MEPTNQGGEALAIYKVVRGFKHLTHGWILPGRFVLCRAIFAKNSVIRHEWVRCFTDEVRKNAKAVNALWVDSMPDPAESKSKQKTKSEVK